MVNQAEKIAPGTTAAGMEAKWTLARPVARPEFCMPTSTERVTAFFQERPQSLATARPKT